MKTLIVGLGIGILYVSALQAGVSYTAVTRIRESGGREREVSRMQVESDGDRARIDFESAQDGGVPRGGYLLTRDGANTVYMVNPGEKTYMEWDLDQLAGMAGSVMQMAGGILNMSVKDHKSETLLDQPGPTMEAMPTRHYKFRTRYTLEMSVMGFAQQTKIATEQEIWAAQGLSDDAMALWKRVSSFKTGMEDIDRLIASETGKIKGFPLKTIVTSTTTDPRGRTETMETVTLVSDIRKTSPDPARFALPEGYTEEQMDVPGGHTGSQSGESPDAALKGLLQRFGR